MQSRVDRNRLLSVFAVLLLLAMACSFSASTDPTESSNTSDSPNLAATQASLEATQAAIDQAQADAEAAAAAAEAAQAEAEAAEAEAAEAEAAQPEADEGLATSDEPPAFFVSDWDFDEELDWWYWYQVSGDEDLWTYYLNGNSALVFELDGENIWAYLFYDYWIYEDVRVDLEVRNVGANNNNVSLICRENERGWYEFNIANNGLYDILRYSYDTGDYTLLYNGGAEEIRTGKDTNWYTAICEGNRLTLGVNGTEVRTVTDNTFVEGVVGISVSSFEVTPVIVEFNWLEISQP